MQAYTLSDLLEVMGRLRDPETGCPWDVKQTFTSITQSTIEEAYELVDAIEQDDFPHMREELGDLLFQVVFYAQMAREASHFDFEDVIHSLTDKLIGRHPHVFPGGDIKARATSTMAEKDVLSQWELLKDNERKEKSHTGLFDDVPAALPALTRAQKIQKRMTGVGFEWKETRKVLSKVNQELHELMNAVALNDQTEIPGKVGDLLFSCVNLSRHLKVDSEHALRLTNNKVEERFKGIEAEFNRRGIPLEKEQLKLMIELWNKAGRENMRL